MKCQADIQALAEERLKDAECLFNNNRFDAAYYLAGYSVELLLKAKVCKTLGIDDFFDFNNPQKTKLAVKNIGEVYKPYKVHDHSQLLIFSGFYIEFQKAIKQDRNLNSHWSIVCKWNENSRYLSGTTGKDAQNFITSIKEIMKWIRRHL
jgi:HEPN domain-containing protein